MITELEKIYLERENKMKELLETMSWEDARVIVDEEYKEQLLSICPEKPLKRGFCVDGKPIQFEIVDINPHFYTLTEKGLPKPKQLSLKNVGKKDPYARILIKKLC